MTREEAIDFLKRRRAYYASLSTDPNPYVKATKVCGYTLAESANTCLMAIEALKKERWIPVSVKMPEEREWIGTKQFGTTKSDVVYVTFETPKGDRFTKHLSFQNGKLSIADQQTINAFYKGSVPIAWMPLPEPYEAESEVER